MFDGVVDDAVGEWFISTFTNTTDQEAPALSVGSSWHKAIQWIVWSFPMISSEMMANG